MPLSVLLQIVSTSAIVTGAVFAVLAYLRGHKAHTQSLNAQLFLDLTQRHSSLVAFRRLEADLKLNDDWDGDLETASAIREYFDLLAHEHALLELGILDHKVWKLWQPEIVRVVNTKLVSQIWHTRTIHLHRASPQFRAYIESISPKHRTLTFDGNTGASARVLPKTNQQPRISAQHPNALPSTNTFNTPKAQHQERSH